MSNVQDIYQAKKSSKSSTYVRMNKYIVNETYSPEPYIHRRAKGGYEAQSSASFGASINKAFIKGIISRQIGAMKNVMQQVAGNSNTMKSFDEVEKFLGLVIKSGELDAKAGKFIEGLKNQKNIPGAEKTINQISAGIGKESVDPSELIKTAGFLENYVKEIGRMLETFDTINVADYAYLADNATFTKSSDKAYSNNVKKLKMQLAQQDAGLTLISGNKTASTAIKKIIASKELLDRYAKNAGPNIPSEFQAGEILRGMMGLINGLSGNFFEVGVNDVINESQNELLAELKRTLGDNVTITDVKSTPQGQTPTAIGGMKREALLNTKSPTSKSDLNLVVHRGAEPTMEIGLTLKTSKLDEKTNKYTTGLLGKTSLNDFLIRTELYDSDIAYHAANMIAHGMTAQGNFTLVKQMLAAKGATLAISGASSAKDTALYMVYREKIISVVDFLKQVHSGKATLSLSMEGAKGLKQKRDTTTERYERSHRALINIYNGTKISVSSRSEG